MADSPNEPGRRGANPPPLITHAPDGLDGSDPVSERRLRTTSIAVAVLGVGTAVALFALLEGAHRPRDCGPADAVHPNRQPCATPGDAGGSGSSGGGSTGGGHGGSGFWSSPTSSSSNYSSSSAAAGGRAGASSASFGGFGASGAAHGGGGGE
jgi:hypothetical protein